VDWHRLFGLLLTDFFTGSPFAVELERDLSFKRQFLDVLIVRKLAGDFPGRLPDGLEDLAPHNLLTFKSHHEALDDWTLKEVTGHYVNYRKQVSPDLNELLPESDFRLLGVCVRFPQNLARDVDLQEVGQGVFDCRRGTDRIRIIVASRVSEAEHNAVWHLFSATPERVQAGAERYEMRSRDASTLLGNLFSNYKVEGFEMPYTMQDYRRDYVKEHLDELSPEERLKGLPAEERLKGLPPEERLKGLSQEELARLQKEAQRLLESGGAGNGDSGDEDANASHSSDS
jgi:hypothetical protein